MHMVVAIGPVLEEKILPQSYSTNWACYVRDILGAQETEKKTIIYELVCKAALYYLPTKHLLTIGKLDGIYVRLYVATSK